MKDLNVKQIKQLCMMKTSKNKGTNVEFKKNN